MERYGDKALGKRRRGRGYRIRLQRQKRLLIDASNHATLATAYVRLNVGDTSQNLETAIKHYLMAADILQQEDAPLFSLCTAGIWTTLGTIWLTYPTENRAGYATQAIEAFRKAKEIVSGGHALMETPGIVTLNQQLWRHFSLATRFEYLRGSTRQLELGSWRMFWGGVPDVFVSGAIVPFFASWIDWQLGVAFQYLGQGEKALTHLDSALRECPDDADVRAAIEVCKGLANLEQGGRERTNNLSVAIASFDRALAAKEMIQSEKTVAQALVGKARVCLEQIDRKAIGLEQRKKVVGLITNQLRAAARTGRRLGMHLLLQESLFLLGKSYALELDGPKTYKTLVLASRVTDRLMKRTRAPRLMRYLVGTSIEMNDLLLRISLDSKVLSQRVKKEGAKALQRILFRVFCFMERGRTVFLQTQLANLNMLPRGASETRLRNLFELRSEWHEAELNVMEKESRLTTDSATLMELRERRNDRESHYIIELEELRKEINDSDYDPDKPLSGLHPAEIHSVILKYLADKQAALVEYHLTSRSGLIFVILPHPWRKYTVPMQVYYVVPDISLAELKSIAGRWTEGYSVFKSTNKDKGPSSIFHWERAFLRQALDRLRPMAEEPARIIRDWEQDTGRRIKRVIAVPHGFLHLVPVHAVPIADGRLWGDSVPIQYVPSTTVLAQLLRSQTRRLDEQAGQPAASNSDKTVSISYSLPSGRRALLFHSLEAMSVAAVNKGTVLDGLSATPNRVKDSVVDSTYIHFACHGTFNKESALDSALELATEEGSSDKCALLTLGDIFRSLRLTRAPLVVLSSCETGLTKTEEGYEEFIGLPAGFLYAGAATVVSALWQVNDIATWLLMRDFAREISTGADATEALRSACQQLRSLSRDSVIQEIARVASKEPNSVRSEQMVKAASSLPQDDFPFASPYWWAGFTVNGLG